MKGKNHAYPADGKCFASPARPAPKTDAEFLRAYTEDTDMRVSD